MDIASLTEALRFGVAGPLRRAAPAVVTDELAPRYAAGGRSRAPLAVLLIVVGAGLTFLGDGAVLAVGVIALAAFIVVGASEMLRPEELERPCSP